jgi:hypothetical protein
VCVTVRGSWHKKLLHCLFAELPYTHSCTMSCTVTQLARDCEKKNVEARE